MGDGAGRCATSLGAYLGVGRYFPLPFPPRGPRRSGPCGKRGGTSDEARSSGGGRRRSGRFTSRATRRDCGFVPGFRGAGELFVRRYAHPDPIRLDAPQKSGSAGTEESRTVRCILTVVELPPRLIGPARARLFRARHRQVVHRVPVAPSRIARHAAPVRLRLVIVSAQRTLKRSPLRCGSSGERYCVKGLGRSPGTPLPRSGPRLASAEGARFALARHPGPTRSMSLLRGPV